jgi:hypothetical protein
MTINPYFYNLIISASRKISIECSQFVKKVYNSIKSGGIASPALNRFNLIRMDYIAASISEFTIEIELL